MLRPTNESPAAKVLGSEAAPELLLAVKIISAILGLFCLYAAFRMAGSFIAQPDSQGAFFLGLFSAMAALGFALWVPAKYQRKYLGIVGIVVGVMELVVSVGIIIKFSAS